MLKDSKYICVHIIFTAVCHDMIFLGMLTSLYRILYNFWSISAAIIPLGLSKAAVNDALGLYLRILKQNNKSTEPTESRSKTADEPGIGSKLFGSPEPATSAGK